MTFDRYVFTDFTFDPHQMFRTLGKAQELVAQNKSTEWEWMAVRVDALKAFFENLEKAAERGQTALFHWYQKQQRAEATTY